MPFHVVPGIDLEPIIVITLSDVIEVKWKDQKTKTRHLVGYDVGHGEGRVSSAIRSESVDDEGIRTFKTVTGRKYTILRDQIFLEQIMEAEYIKGRWQLINEDIIENVSKISNFIPEEYFIDVSDETL